MATPFRLKRSAVSGKRPSLNDLQLGELALNTYDGYLFAERDTSGVGIGTTIALLTPWTENFGAESIYYSKSVGIGIELPSATLDVNGTLNVSGVSNFNEVDIVGILNVVNTSNLNNTTINGQLDSTFLSTFNDIEVNGFFNVSSGINISGFLDVDGHTELDDLNVSGVSTFVGVGTFQNDLYVGGNFEVAGTSEFIGVVTFRGGTINIGDSDTDDVVVGGEFASNLVPTTDGLYDLGTSGKQWRDLYITGTIDTDQLNVSGLSTFASNVDINADLDVDGFTELDATNISETLNVVGLSTFGSNVDINASVDISTNLVVDGLSDLDELNVAGIATFNTDVEFVGSTAGVTSAYWDSSANLLNFKDDVKATFGDGNDLQIYHDGDHSYVRDIGAGRLYLDGSSVHIRSNSNELAIEANQNAEVALYYDNSKKFETTGIGVSISNGGTDTATIAGPENLIIDPAAVGDNTGIVRIKGDLYVDGTTTQINSTTIELADFIVGIATTATSDLLADGAGIRIGPDNTFLYEYNNGNNPSLKSSENLNVDSGKHYQIGETEVLSSTTLGSGVVNSSLTSVGTLGQLNVSGVSTLGPQSVTTDATSKAEMVSKAALRIKPHPTNSGALNFAQVASGGAIGLQFTNETGTTDWDIALQPFGGNVGIGTDNPSYKLQVAGNTLLRTLSFDGAYSNIGGFTRAQLNGALGISNGSGYSAFAWNYSGGGGEWDLLVNRNGGNTGGFNIYDAGNDSNDPTLLFKLTGSGDLTLPSSTLLVNRSTPTGTASQSLQVDGGAYVSGNLGVGATNPVSELHVSGRITGTNGTNNDANSIGDLNADFSTWIRIGDSLGTQTFTNGLGIKYHDSGNRHYSTGILGDKFYISHTSSDGDKLFPSSRTDIIVAHSSGNVGIGTDNPSEKLDVRGDIRVQSDIPEIKFRSEGDVYQYYIGANISDSVNGGFIIGEGSGITAGTERIRIDYLGNVGIGTDNPVNKLQVFGGIVAGDATSSTIQSGFSILRPNDSTPRTFAIVEDDTNLRIGGGAWYNVNIRTAPSNEIRVAITSTGNVGINSTSPSEILDVGGNIGISNISVTGATTATLSTLTETAIHTGLSASTYRSVEYTIQATEGTNYHSTKVLVVHDDSTAYHNEYGTIYNNSSVATFNADIDSGNIRLLATGASANSTVYKIHFIATKI